MGLLRAGQPYSGSGFIVRYTQGDMKNDTGGNSVRGGAAPDLLTVEQAANYLQLSPSSIRSYMRQGKLKGFRIAGLRKVLIPRTELLLLLEPARADPLDEGDGANDAPALATTTRQPVTHSAIRLTK
jgi:excisionase family DNA binding protein